MPIEIPLMEHVENMGDNKIDKYFIGETEVTIEMLYNGMASLQTAISNLEQTINNTASSLASHVEHDAGLYQSILSAARDEAYKIYEGTEPPLSSIGIPIVSTQGGLLVFPEGDEYSCPQNGGITITFSAVLALGSLQVLVDGVSVFDTAVLSLLSVPPPTTVRVNGGQVVTVVGTLGLLSSLSVMFYPNIDL